MQRVRDAAPQPLYMCQWCGVKKKRGGEEGGGGKRKEEKGGSRHAERRKCGWMDGDGDGAGQTERGNESKTKKNPTRGSQNREQTQPSRHCGATFLGGADPQFGYHPAPSTSGCVALRQGEKEFKKSSASHYGKERKNAEIEPLWRSWLADGTGGESFLFPFPLLALSLLCSMAEPRGPQHYRECNKKEGREQVGRRRGLAVQ